MAVKLMDCTLRDGGNVVGDGFPADLTEMILEGLISSRVSVIELGNAKGIGAYESAGSVRAETDLDYLKLAQKYLHRGADLGMFLNAKRFEQKNVDLAAEYGLDFLRVGANAGDGAGAVRAVKAVKAAGLKAYYSLMKAYVLSPEELAEEGKMLEEAGLDEITVMDSAGTMLPEQAAAYTEKLKAAVSIPVGFHCHNNLGLSAANAVAAYRSGADILDCGLMGMARSAGNLPTEVCAALMRRYGEMQDIDLFALLSFIDKKLMPAMEKHGYRNAITPLDLVLGYAGCHSSFVKKFRAVAEETGVDLFRLIIEVSEKNQKDPSEELMRETADRIRG